MLPMILVTCPDRTFQERTYPGSYGDEAARANFQRVILREERKLIPLEDIILIRLPSAIPDRAAA